MIVFLSPHGLFFTSVSHSLLLTFPFSLFQWLVCLQRGGREGIDMFGGVELSSSRQPLPDEKLRGGVRGRGKREINIKGGAYSNFAFNGYIPMMCVDHVLHDFCPQSGSAGLVTNRRGGK